MNTKESPASGREPLPRASAWLLYGQLALSLVALAAAILPFCGRCGSGSLSHAAVATLGVSGYAALLLLHRKGKTHLASAGIIAAGGVHAALGGIMLSGGPVCEICAAAAFVALAHVALVLVGMKGSRRWILRVIVPSFSLTWIVAFLALSASAADKRARAEAASRSLVVVSSSAPAPSLDRTTLTVFEMDGCHYCVEFRRVFAPRIAQEFPDVQLVYRKAENELWVRRTPTIALGDKVLFEGLPARFSDLSRAIEENSQTPAQARR